MGPGLSLSVVIPMWNEKEAVIPVLTRSVAARQGLLTAEPRLREVEIIMVDDGSTDGTPELAATCHGARVVRCNHRGYGAALKTGFRTANGDLLGFMDGDYTCDVSSFGNLVSALLDRQVHIVNGNRLHRGSHMPLSRKGANRLAGLMFSFVTGKKVTDSCTGIRVFQRSLLPLVDQLPDDLSFSPALTARVLFSSELRLAEARVSYADRLGDSKLSFFKDAWKFHMQLMNAWRDAGRDVSQTAPTAQTARPHPVSEN